MFRNLMLSAGAFGCALTAMAATNEVPQIEKWHRYHLGTNNFCTVIKYDRPDRRPIWFGAASRCESAPAGGGDYCFYLDLIEEGAPEWAVKAEFSRRIHDWESVERVFVPARPVKEIRCYLFLRKVEGRAWFDKPFLYRELPPAGHVLSAARRTYRPFAEKDCIEQERSNGKKIVKETVFDKPTYRPENPLGTDEIVVWTADSMRRVSPLAFPTADERRTPRLDLDLALGERESAQVCISTGNKAEAKAVQVEVGPLVSDRGEKFDGTVDLRRIGYLARRSGYSPHPFGPDERETWFAEPLLPLAPLTVSPGSTRGVWLTVQARRSAQPGVYKGVVTVGGQTEIPLTVRVRSFALPETFGLKTAYCVMDGFTRAAYPDDFKAKKRESWDIMLDHRLNPDDISRTTPPDIDDLLYARSRGMNSFNALNLVPPPKDPRGKWVCWAAADRVFSPEMHAYLDRTLGPYVAKLREHGLDRLAYLYGFDERGTEFYPQLLDFWQKVKGKFGLNVLTTAYMFRDVTLGRIKESSPYATMTDWHCPPLTNYDGPMADRYRAKGKKVWIYTCCGPRYPYMNCSSYEYPLIECRLLGWTVRRLKADGFLFWNVNYWERPGKLDETETFFPAWNTHSGLHMPGDGVFLYPGKEHILSGIRLANIRDGEEDYEWLQMAERRAGREAVEKIMEQVVRDKTDFTRDPALVRSLRKELGDLIEQTRK